VPTDPLPSWNEGAAKARFVDFVRRVTTEATPDFVPVPDRIAVFDNDGTLWPEQPICIQFVFAFDRLTSLAHVHPELRKIEPFRAVLEGGLNILVTFDADRIIEIIKATQSGMSTEQFSEIVAGWLATAKDPRFGRFYTDLVYQPMLELLDYLRANEFKSFIVSGTGADFIRVFAEETYRIPPEQVVGSTTVVEFRLGETGPMLMKIPEVEVLRDGAGKPVAIDRFIGRRPIFAFGNSDGDKEMLVWTAAGAGPHLVGLLHHTDAKREWAYDRDSKVGRLDKALDLAGVRDWTIVDMATDWNSVFPPPRDAVETG
jgi:phosphoglycolate phosphatase-like HAD superfamily hydrolase